MHLITKEKFLEQFDAPKNPVSSFKVRTGNGELVSLRDYAKHHNVPNEDIKLLMEHINNRNEYLERFYDVSLRPVDPLRIVHQTMTMNKFSNNQHVEYKNIIRNIYYREILQTTKSGLENLPSFLTVLEDLYLIGVIDYKILTPSGRHYLREGRIGSVFSSLYFRASILNPYLIYSLNHRVLHGERIFTPTLGWSAYFYGFMECEHVKEYVGTDVIPKVCRNTQAFASKFYPNKISDIWCSPSEELYKNIGFNIKYHKHFDVVFFSPPYFQLEVYPGTRQSTFRYKTYEEWLQKYWKVTLKLCYRILKSNGRLCYIVSNYGDKPSLMKDMDLITQDLGFIPYKTIKMANKAIKVNASQTDNSETICIFLRP
jgi:hypothetical protein